jgi:hypothetical protein
MFIIYVYYLEIHISDMYVRRASYDDIHSSDSIENITDVLTYYKHYANYIRNPRISKEIRVTNFMMCHKIINLIFDHVLCV